ncbi:MAG: hypothetical protein K0R40_1482 [Burkholderiales bacterium]|nr:hypothetical protein [Burkholderiales bacterium]
MAEESGRTLVCSVLFVDIVEYSKTSVAEQFELKNQFNDMLTESLEVLQRRDRVIIDSGDGAAVVFLGDPEDALVVGLAMREHAKRLPMRLGINLGPVKLMSDLNDQVNVVGDGINVAQRVMSFAAPGQLLVSGNYHDVVSRLSERYAYLFSPEGRREDKHVRSHNLYSVSHAIRIQDGDVVIDDAPRPSKPAAGREPAKVHDAGASLMISASTREAVAEALERLLREGATLVSPVAQVGNKWLASCASAAKAVKVEQFGHTRVITGADPQAVAEKAAEFVSFGARLVQPAELVDGVWMAVCDTAAS